VSDLLPYLHGTTVNGTRSPTDIDLDNLSLKELRAYSVYSVRETRHKTIRLVSHLSPRVSGGNVNRH
jgi:hypothetical protein